MCDREGEREFKRKRETTKKIFVSQREATCRDERGGEEPMERKRKKERRRGK